MAGVAQFVPYKRRRGASMAASERSAPRVLRQREQARTSGVKQGLDLRPASPGDLRWIMTHAMAADVPAPRSSRTRWHVLIKDGTRVGYLAARSETFNGQPVRWISSLFILPAYQRQGLAPQFMALASQRYFQKGNVGCRVATTNVRVIRLLMDNGFRKVRQTTQWVDLFFELPQTFVSGR